MDKVMGLGGCYGLGYVLDKVKDCLGCYGLGVA